MTPVTCSETLKDVLQELQALISKAGLRPGLLLLDRGFYSVEIIRYLQQARRLFLMLVIGHGRKAGHPEGPSGSNVFKLMTKERLVHRHASRTPRKRKRPSRSALKRYRARRIRMGGRSGTIGCMPTGEITSQRRGLWSSRPDREAVRDRDWRPVDERVLDWDDDQEVQRVVPLRGDRTVAEGTGGVWLHDFVLSSPWRGCWRDNWDRLPVERMLLWLEQVAAEMHGLILRQQQLKEIYRRVSYDMTR